MAGLTATLLLHTGDARWLVTGGVVIAVNGLLVTGVAFAVFWAPARRPSRRKVYRAAVRHLDAGRGTRADLREALAYDLIHDTTTPEGAQDLLRRLGLVPLSVATHGNAAGNEMPLSVDTVWRLHQHDPRLLNTVALLGIPETDVVAHMDGTRPLDRAGLELLLALRDQPLPDAA